MKKKTILLCTAFLIIAGAIYITTRNKTSALLERHQLSDLSYQDLITQLETDTSLAKEINAQVTGRQLILKDDVDTMKIDNTDELFYLSFAPYVDVTHPCFDHVPTGCQGELPKRDFNVTITDADGNVLLQETRTSASNGFIGVFLPRDIKATIVIEHYGQTASAEISTYSDSETCLTTLQLKNPTS